jgi:diguanylate cyclase (GGDEF)-like protein/PAS domain S-box-containing protein
MLFVSEGCYELTGYPSSSLINNNVIAFNDLISPEFRDYVWEKWSGVIDNQIKFAGEYEIITASGETKWVFERGQAIYDENGNLKALEGLIIDITDRKHKEDEIVFLNNHDFLTGLYNRRFLEQEKDRMAREEYLPLSVMIGDINGVKLVNDAFGHAEGDILIQETAKIIRECCRESDIAARTGGDEFLILMPNTDTETANRIMNKIITLTYPYSFGSAGTMDVIIKDGYLYMISTNSIVRYDLDLTTPKLIYSWDNSTTIKMRQNLSNGNIYLFSWVTQNSVNNILKVEFVEQLKIKS